MPANLRASVAPFTRSLATTRTVSSPATVPITSASPARSRADATTWAQPGGVRTITRLPELATLATHSPRTRRRCSSGSGRSFGCDRQGVHQRPARPPHFDRAEFFEVSGNGDLRRFDPLVRQHLDQFGLVGDALLFQDLTDPVLTLGLGQLHENNHNSTARMARSRLAA